MRVACAAELGRRRVQQSRGTHINAGGRVVTSPAPETARDVFLSFVQVCPEAAAAAATATVYIYILRRTIVNTSEYNMIYYVYHNNNNVLHYTLDRCVTQPLPSPTKFTSAGRGRVGEREKHQVRNDV